MTIRKFNCVVERRDEYIIEIDDSIINEEWMKDFSEYMYKFHELKEHAEHLAQIQARFGDTMSFIEGYGNVKRDGGYSYDVNDLKCDGINIVIMDEDNDCEIEVTEI